MKTQSKEFNFKGQNIYINLRMKMRLLCYFRINSEI